MYTCIFTSAAALYWSLVEHHLKMRIHNRASAYEACVYLGCASLESALAWHSASSALSCRSGTLRPSWSLQVALRSAFLSSAPASFSCSQRRSHAPSQASSHSQRSGLPVSIRPPAKTYDITISL